MMKKLLLPAVILAFGLISCSDDDDNTPGPPDPEPFMDTTAGATRDYRMTSHYPPAAPVDYTLTTTNRDTATATRAYRVFENNNGPNRYYTFTGSDYYTVADIGGPLQGILLESLYLRSNLNEGNTWVENFSNLTVVGLPGTVSGKVTHKIEAKGQTRTVSGEAFTDVIHVSSTIHDIVATVELIPGAPMNVPIPPEQFSTDVHNYYAPRVGMIENSTIVDVDIDQMGFQLSDSSSTSAVITGYNIP